MNVEINRLRVAVLMVFCGVFVSMSTSDAVAGWGSHGPGEGICGFVFSSDSDEAYFGAWSEIEKFFSIEKQFLKCFDSSPGFYTEIRVDRPCLRGCEYYFSLDRYCAAGAREYDVFDHRDWW